MSEETKEIPFDPNTLINFAVIRSDGSDSWKELWDESLSVVENVESLLRQAVAYPDERFYKLATIYLCLPSALSRICPILVCYGKKGSGKSTTGFIGSKLYNSPVLTGADTFASIRNALDATKYLRTGKEQSFERNTMMVWDDLDPFVFIERPNLYRMLKSGYNRNSDRISIASAKAGENITMRVFAPRIISSVTALHNIPELDELSRRCMVIATKPIEDFSKRELKVIGCDVSSDFEPLDLQTVNWKGIESQLFNFWNDKDKASEFVLIRRSLSRKNNKFQKESNMSSNSWTISCDLMATAITSGYMSHDEAVAFFDDYWQWHQNHCKEGNSAFNALLQEFIEHELSSIQIANTHLINAGQSPLPELIPANNLKKQIQIWQGQGALDKRPTIDTIVNEMRQLNFKLTTQGWLKVL
jgi:hypothetical protein